MNKDEHIKKLERRIHNQRAALRSMQRIIEQQMNHRHTPLRSMWFEKVKELSREIQELRKAK